MMSRTHAGRAPQVRRASRCVAVLAVSDEPSFLTAWSKLALDGGLLAWPTMLLALTRLPLPRLTHLHATFWKVNALLITCDGVTSPR